MILEKATQFKVSLVSRPITSDKMAELINVVEAGNARDVDNLINDLATRGMSDEDNVS